MSETTLNYYIVCVCVWHCLCLCVGVWHCRCVCVWHCLCVCSEMNKGIDETKRHYQRMMFKEALRTGFFEFQVSMVFSYLTLMESWVFTACCCKKYAASHV